MRFGVNLLAKGSINGLIEQARHAEQVGFDSVLLSDHLGAQAPLAPLIAIAHAVPHVRVGNMVINASFCRPALLARELASVDAATGGRLDIGLGTGYVEAEFEEAGLPFPTPGQRVELLTEHVVTIRERLSDPAYIPTPSQAPPPILVAGAGDRLLAMAAQHADTVAIVSMGTETDLGERVSYVRRMAGSRAGEIEIAFSFFQVSLDDPTDLAVLSLLAPDASDAELHQMATYLGGPLSEGVDQITRLHDELGITYFALNKTPGTSWGTLEKLMSALK